MIGDILQPTHLLFILVIALLVLGPKRLPEVGRSLGRGLRDFRSAVSGDDTQDEVVTHSVPPSVEAAAPTFEPAPPTVEAAPPVVEPAPPMAAPAPVEPASEPVQEPVEHVG